MSEPTPTPPESREENVSIPDVLPVMALKDTVLFPFVMVPLSVGRERSVAAVDQALAENRLILLLAQKDGKSMVASIAIEALGGLGPAGGPPLMDLLDRALKAKEPSAETYGNCLRAIKKAADPRPATVKGLLELLKYKLDDVVAKAADAISGYKDAPGKVRREMLEEVIKQSEGVFSSSKDAKNGSAVTKWRIIQGSVLSALNALSGQQFADPSAARAWFNDHKKDKQWD